MEDRKIIIKRGEIALSNQNIFVTNISSCVSVCFYHSIINVGAITHISASRQDDTTPSGKFIKENGLYYTDIAIAGILDEFKKKYNVFHEKNFKIVIAGGLTKEGPIEEALGIIKKYNFNIVGVDTMKNIYRQVIFDTAFGKVRIYRKKPFSEKLPYKEFHFKDNFELISYK